MESYSSISTGHNYELDLEIDPESASLRGDQRTVFHNFYSVSLNEIGFTLDFNSARFKGYSMEIEEVEDERGKGLEWSHPEIDGKSDKSILLVEPRRKLSPGECARLKLKFHGTLRPIPSGDYLTLPDSYFGFTPSYYPRVLNLHNGEWKMGEYRDYVSGSYKVSLTLPEEQILAASGIVVRQDALEDNRNRVILAAENVRGFGLVMSPDFEFHRDNVQDITIQSYYFPDGKKRAKKLVDYAKDILGFYLSDMGFYPWKNIAILPGSSTSTGGYATSNMIFIHLPEPYDNFLRWITAHEIAHQYWGIYIGDPNEYPKWLSLGLTQWLDERYERSKTPQLRRKPYQYYLSGLAIGVDTTIMQRCEDLENTHFDWNNIIAHSKAYTVIKMLENLVGERNFEEIVMRLLRDYACRIVYAEQFQNLCEQMTNQDLGWFFSQWVYTDKKLDYRIVDTTQNSISGKYNVKVKVKRLGDARMPIPVRVSFQDGQEETKIVGKDLVLAELDFKGSSPMKNVTLDPDGRLPLKNRIKEIEPRRLGYLLFNSGKYRQATQKFREALKETPEDALMHFIMGLCLYDIKEYNESVEAFRKTVDLVGSDNSDYRKAWSHIWIGHIFDIEGKRKEAIEEYEHAIATGNRTSAQFGQYGIDSDAVTWAKQRIKDPFVRTEG